MPETQFPYPTTCEPFGSVIVALHRAVSTFPEGRVAAALLVITIEALPVKLAGCAAFADMLVSSPANAQANIAIIAIYSLHIYIFLRILVAVANLRWMLFEFPYFEYISAPLPHIVA